MIFFNICLKFLKLFKFYENVDILFWICLCMKYKVINFYFVFMRFKQLLNFRVNIEKNCIFFFVNVWINKKKNLCSFVIIWVKNKKEGKKINYLYSKEL